MKNIYLKNLNKIEFVVTNACTGQCKHCSEGGHKLKGERIDPLIAADAVRKISAEYDIKTVMAFGGEPLLYPDAVYAIINAARDMNIPRRQVITNGYITKDKTFACHVAERLAECGVNDLLLSVDAFHQETIPLDEVRDFAISLMKQEVPVRLSPAWLVSRSDDNAYNVKTREILEIFKHDGVCEGEGNVVFPEGYAILYLSEYFKNDVPINPYVESPMDIKCISFSPNGDVLNGNVYRNEIMDIIENYGP